MDKLFWSLVDEMDINGIDLYAGGLLFVFLWIILITVTVIVTSWLIKHKEKRTWKIPALVLMGILFLTLLEIPLKLTYQKANSVTRDRELLEMMKNDGRTPEFVLNKEYYVLPCPLQKFIDNGWDRSWWKGNAVTVHELPQSEKEIEIFSLPTAYGYLRLVVRYDDETGYDLADGIVIAAVYDSSTKQTELNASPNVDFFITPFGMTENISFHGAEKLLGKAVSGEYVSVEKDRYREIFTDITFGNNVVFRTEAFQDYLQEEGSNQALIRQLKEGGHYDYGLYHKDITYGTYYKDYFHGPLALWIVRLIVWACLFGTAGIIILAVLLIRKQRLKQK